MTPNIERYRKIDQPATFSNAVIKTGTMIVSGLLIAAPCAHAFEDCSSAHFSAESVVVGGRGLTLDVVMPKLWSQYHSAKIPSDEDFSGLAVDLFLRQKNIPHDIGVVLAQHMTDLYD